MSSIGGMRGICLFLVVFSFWSMPSFSQVVECGAVLNIGTIIPDTGGGSVGLNSLGRTYNLSGNSVVAVSGSVGSVVIRGLSDGVDNYKVSFAGDGLYGDGEMMNILNINDGEEMSGTLFVGAEKSIKTFATVSYGRVQKAGTYSGYYTVMVDFENSGKRIVETCPVVITVQNESIEIVESRPLNFGLIAKDVSTGGVVRVSPSGGATVVSGNVDLLSSDVWAGEFTVKASPYTIVNLSFNSGVLNGSGSSMHLDNFVSDKGTSVDIPASGMANIKIGADLFVNDKQKTGSYNGTYEIIVNY